jgi:hypothetical protein
MRNPQLKIRLEAEQAKVILSLPQAKSRTENLATTAYL